MNFLVEKDCGVQFAGGGKQSNERNHPKIENCTKQAEVGVAMQKLQKFK